MKISRSLVLALALSFALGLLPNAVPAQTAANINVVGEGRAASAAPTPARVNPQVQPGAGYVIGIGDVLNINVWREAEISQKLAVRPDGMITLPLIGDVVATGQTPEQLADRISKMLESVLTSPQVTVIVDEVHSKFYSVVGQVAKPGQFPLTRPTTVLDAISQAGGFHDFAKTGKMYVLHYDKGKRVQIPFNYKLVVKGKKPQQDIEVSPGDVIVVP